MCFWNPPPPPPPHTRVSGWARIRIGTHPDQDLSAVIKDGIFRLDWKKEDMPPVFKKGAKDLTEFAQFPLLQNPGTYNN